MSGHLLYPHVDSNPASTSSVWLKDILREEMGYSGIIVADDIKMEALGGPIPQTAIKALTAGNDMIIVITDSQTLYAVRDTLVEFFGDENTQPALDASLARILTTKYQFLLDHRD